MHIVILDGHTLNPGDLSWDAFGSLGELTVHDRTPPEQVVPRAAGSELILTNKTRLTADALAQLPALRYIGVLATGYDVVDVDAAARRGIPVTNVPEYGTHSVAEMVFAHVFNLCRHVAEHAAGVREGRWSRSPDFCYWDRPLRELAGGTMGLVGLGRIGRAVARIAGGLGMRVLAHDPHPCPDAPDAVVLTDLDTLLRESDVVSLHCPLTDATRHLIDADRLALMQPHAFLVNTSRGPLVDEAALVEALEMGAIAGAGLDVLTQEPPDAENPLFGAPNCYITPHIAWATPQARGRLMQTAFENARAFLRGERRNVVNGV
jgi:glycerate dehydrogenase